MIFLDILIPKMYSTSPLYSVFIILYSFSLRPFGGGGLKVSRICLICLGAMVPPLRTLAMTTDMVFDISVELTERVMLIDQMSQ